MTFPHCAFCNASHRKTIAKYRTYGFREPQWRKQAILRWVKAQELGNAQSLPKA